MKPVYSILFVLLISFSSFAQKEKLRAFALYNKKGKAVTFEKMIKDLSNADVVLWGELHNNSMVHWLQLQTIEQLKEEGNELVLGAEMFEADDQLVMDEYMNGLIKGKHFEKEAKMWNNYSTDYKPLVEFAKTNNYPFVATNIPRRYANLVSRKGVEALDSLQPEARNYMAPLPAGWQVDTATPGYSEMIDMMGAHGMHGDPMTFVAAQASKDITMAHFISQNLKEQTVFVHFNGDFHSKNYGGIYWYLKQANEELSISVISCVEAASLEFNDARQGRADYLFVIPDDMAKSY